MDYKVVLVEDEADAGQMLKDFLEHKGLSTRWFRDGGACMQALEKTEVQPELFILDVMLPEISGVDILKYIRQNEQLLATPVIMLTAKDNEGDIISGLETGADAYLTKPTPFSVVHAYATRLLRKTPGLQLGSLVLDTEFKQAIGPDGQALGLTITEYRILEHLCRHLGRVFSRDSLLYIADPNSEKGLQPRTIDAHIKNLRHKLGENAGLLHTIRGVGYCIKLEAHEDNP